MLLLGSAGSTSSVLYAAIYPTPLPTAGSNRLPAGDFKAQLEAALAEARVTSRTEPTTVVGVRPGPTRGECRVRH